MCDHSCFQYLDLIPPLEILLQSVVGNPQLTGTESAAEGVNYLLVGLVFRAAGNNSMCHASR